MQLSFAILRSYLACILHTDKVHKRDSLLGISWATVWLNFELAYIIWIFMDIFFRFLYTLWSASCHRNRRKATCRIAPCSRVSHVFQNSLRWCNVQRHQKLMIRLYFENFLWLDLMVHTRVWLLVEKEASNTRIELLACSLGLCM